jgi:putative hydroxymethylpyrimidine transport system substrate-binding protein
MKNIITGIIALVLTLTLALPAHAAANFARGTRALRPITLWLDWYPNSDHAGIYVALTKGYYARRGLAVQPRVPSGTADALKLVARGDGDLAVSYEPTLLLARQQGVPVVATAAIVQSPLNCIISLQSSGITRPRQLVGKTVGVAGLDSDYTDIRAMVRHDGGDPAKVKTVNVGYGLLPQLLKGRVDAVEGVYWTWEALQAQQQGYKVNVMRLDHYGVPTYDELIFATGTGQLARESATLRLFQQATFEGYAYAATHPAEAARILLKAPQVLSNSESLIEHSIRLLSPVERDAHGRYGTMSATQWQSYADWMRRTGLVKKSIDARAALTETLLP